MPALALLRHPRDWARMQVLGARRPSRAFASDPQIRASADTVSLNPARIPADRVGDRDVAAAMERVRRSMRPGVSRLAELAGMREPPQGVRAATSTR